MHRIASSNNITWAAFYLPAFPDLHVMQLSARYGARVENRLAKGKEAKQLHVGTTTMPWRALLHTHLIEYLLADVLVFSFPLQKQTNRQHFPRRQPAHLHCCRPQHSQSVVMHVTCAAIHCAPRCCLNVRCHKFNNLLGGGGEGERGEGERGRGESKCTLEQVAEES
jgi:hypothetical protein